MNVQKVALGRGWQWVQDGFQIFMRSPLQWIIMSLVIMGAMYLLGMIPLLGMPLIYLLSPLAIAGMMAAARALDNGREINVNYLLWGFREGGSRLVFLGGVFFVAQLVIGAIVTNLAGPDATQLMSSGTMIDPKTITPDQANRLFTAMAVGMMLMVPVALMLWFAPALVVMDGVSAPQALMLSLRGCLANVIPTMIFGSAMMLLMMLVIISLGFGVFIWLPVAVTATYRSYVDVFGKAPAGPPQENTE